MHIIIHLLCGTAHQIVRNIILLIITSLGQAIWEMSSSRSFHLLVTRKTQGRSNSAATLQRNTPPKNNAVLRSLLIVAAWAIMASCLQLRLLFLQSSPNEITSVIRNQMWTRDIAEGPQGRIQSVMPNLILWDEDKTYFQHCRKNILNNETWGEKIAPLVDKMLAKDIVKEWSPELEVLPTYAHLGPKNASKDVVWELLHNVPQPFIIKPTHFSGSVAKVSNNTYGCLKTCLEKDLSIDSTSATDTIWKRAKLQVNLKYGTKGSEMQYKFVAPRIMFEPALNMSSTNSTSSFKDVTYWYLAGGVPVFVSLECHRDTTGEKRTFLSTRFHRLPMSLSMETCEVTPPRPKMWDRMHRVARAIAAHLPDEIVRLDLYSSDTAVVFSELTFTTSACTVNFSPAVADGLLYSLKMRDLEPALLTPEYVERTISENTWVELDTTIARRFTARKTSPSPLDFCRDRRDTQQCLVMARSVAEKPLRCFLRDATTGDQQFKVYGVDKMLSWYAVFWKDADLDRVAALLSIYCLLHWRHRSCAKKVTSKKRSASRAEFPLINYMLCLVGMALFMCVRANHKGFISEESIIQIISECFHTFRAVHPVNSMMIAFSHFATYWFLVASWCSRTLRQTVFWLICYEVVTATVNEYMHHQEADNVLHCTRVAFIGEMKSNIFDELIRVYILPPFFVYGYLLPQILKNLVME